MKLNIRKPQDRARSRVAIVMALLAGAIHLALAGTPVTSGLVGLWEAENNALDTSGRGNHGTLVGGVAFAPGVVGQAFDFRGSLKFVQVADHASLDGFSQATWSFWVRLPNPTGPLMGFMDKRTNSDVNNAYTKFVNDSSQVYWAEFGIELGNASGGWSNHGAVTGHQAAEDDKLGKPGLGGCAGLRGSDPDHIALH